MHRIPGWRAVVVRAALGAGLCAALSALPGCALPGQTQHAAQTVYRLQASTIVVPAPAVRPVVIRVAPFGAAPGLEGSAMLYSPQPTQLLPYRDSRWLAPPSPMIGAALTQALAHQPWVAAVEHGAEPAPARWSLHCDVTRLEHDLPTHRARLSLRCELYDDARSDWRRTWLFDAAQAMPVDDAEHNAAASQQALNRVTRRLLQDLVRELSAD